MYPHTVGGMAPRGGGGTPPPGKGGPPKDKTDDESDEEENDESDTDEGTILVTSSSQASVGRIKLQKGESEEKNNQGRLEACPRTQMTPL